MTREIEKKSLIVLVGPTAVGKSWLGMLLAQELKTEIISVDAMQIYKYMDIGTAKPSIAERAIVRHHLIDIVYPDEDYNAGLYSQEARVVINRLLGCGKIPLLAGGCGLYLKALLYGLFQGPAADSELREKLREEAQQKGGEYLHEKVKQIDPETAQRVHPHDQSRLIRAMEVYLKTGIPISTYQRQHAFPDSPYQPIIIGLTRDRSDLYNRIEKRVDEMIEQGLAEEVKTLLERGYSKDSTALQGLGYKQIIPCLKGEYSLEKAVLILKRDTRHYAKRQLTWFRALPNVQWLNLTDEPSLAKIIEKIQNLRAGFWT